MLHMVYPFKTARERPEEVGGVVVKIGLSKNKIKIRWLF